MVFTPPHNHLLASLSEATQERLFRLMELVVLPQGKILYETGEIISHIYFPVDSIISLLHVMGNGDSAEVSVTGNEGLVGMPSIDGSRKYNQPCSRTECWSGVSDTGKAASG